MNQAVFTNAMRGLSRGRMMAVAAAMIGVMALLQAISVANERHMLEQEQRHVEGAARDTAAPMVSSGAAKLTGRAYLEALRADSAATLREEALHYETLFAAFVCLFVFGAALARETANGGLDRTLAAPVSRTAAAASLLGASFAFTQACLTVLFLWLEIRVWLFSSAAPFLFYKYLALTAIHVMVLCVTFLCHTLLGRGAAFAASAGAVFLGFASYAVHAAGADIASPGLRAAARAYVLLMPQMGTLFFEVLDRMRPGVFPDSGIRAAWYAAEAARTACLLAVALWVFHRKN